MLVAPIIPFINDQYVEAVLDASHDAGAFAASYTIIRLPYELKALWKELADDALPGPCRARDGAHPRPSRRARKSPRQEVSSIADSRTPRRDRADAGKPLPPHSYGESRDHSIPLITTVAARVRAGIVIPGFVAVRLNLPRRWSATWSLCIAIGARHGLRRRCPAVAATGRDRRNALDVSASGCTSLDDFDGGLEDRRARCHRADRGGDRHGLGRRRAMGLEPAPASCFAWRCRSPVPVVVLLKALEAAACSTRSMAASPSAG